MVVLEETRPEGHQYIKINPLGTMNTHSELAIEYYIDLLWAKQTFDLRVG